jgi:hypothetical protein
VNRRSALLQGAALVAIALLPLLGDAVRKETVRCSQDGVHVDSAYAVVADFAGQERHHFCGVTCADRWLSRSGRTASAVSVTDCVSGDLIDARRASYVRTSSGWNQGVPDPIRVFASRPEAAEHVRAYGGELLVGLDRPLQHAVSSRWVLAPDGP